VGERLSRGWELVAKNALRDPWDRKSRSLKGAAYGRERVALRATNLRDRLCFSGKKGRVAMLIKSRGKRSPGGRTSAERSNCEDRRKKTYSSSFREDEMRARVGKESTIIRGDLRPSRGGILTEIVTSLVEEPTLKR